MHLKLQSFSFYQIITFRSVSIGAPAGDDRSKSFASSVIISIFGALWKFVLTDGGKILARRCQLEHQIGDILVPRQWQLSGDD